MKSISKIFLTLQELPIPDGDSFNIEALPSVKNHKIGISQNGNPVFFIKCSNLEIKMLLDINLEFISVAYNCSCQLLLNSKETTEGTYTLISLNVDVIELREYFLEVVYLVVKKLSATPKLVELKNEVEKLIDLFSKFSNPPLKTVQGLWAELLVIEQSSNPAYLISAWHSTPNDKFDFNDGIDKIEVKSTAKSRRIHKFSSEQLNPNVTSNLVIASVFAIETGQGKSVFDLIELISEKIEDTDLIFRLNEIAVKTMGMDFEKACEKYFDYHWAIDELAFFNNNTIPKIDSKYIPKEITNVQFDCDLTKFVPIKKGEHKSKLLKSLIQTKS
jgi:hypothetical protein